MRLPSLAEIDAWARKLVASVRFAATAQVLRRSGAFDARWYRATYADSAGWDPILHYLAVGSARGHRPDLLFDPQWWGAARGLRGSQNAFLDYLTTPERWTLSPSACFVLAPDLADADRTPSSSPLSIYRATRGTGGLSPARLLADAFDQNWYRATYPDCGQADAVWHFLTSGESKDHRPHPLFDAAWWLDTVGPGDQPSPFLGYLLSNRRWTVPPSPYAQIIENSSEGSPLGAYNNSRGSITLQLAPVFVETFDANWYRATYPESAGTAAELHFIGAGESKRYLPHPLFDAEWWSVRSSARGPTRPFMHYLTSEERWALPPSPYLELFAQGDSTETPLASPLARGVSGGTSGLRISPLFDAAFYLRNNPDVAAAGIDPLLHFAANGGREGRSPCASFDAFHYLSVSPDVAEAGDEPLRHFIMRGAAEARAPHRAVDPETVRGWAGTADLLPALVDYQREGRHRLDAMTHPRLPPPGAAAPLFDDWPWTNPSVATARGRLLVLAAGPPAPDLLSTLSQLATDQSHPVPWIVALDAPAEATLGSTSAPSLSIANETAGALPALLRASALAGPHLTVAVAAPHGHRAHALVTQRGDIPIVALADLLLADPAPLPPASISVAVPCYNHAAFIEERLASIVAQRRAIDEIIVIDDASTDGSLDRVRAFAERSPVPIEVVARQTNSGSPFSAWAEGAAMARGELLWIAESDDLADPRLLERLAPFLERDPRVVLAYCQSSVIGPQGERLADDHLFYTDEIDPRRWESPYLVDGETEIRTALAIKNTIPNVSGVLFRRDALAEVAPAIVGDRYCGDWRAYALLAARGWIGFSPEPLNAARRHGRNATAEGERTELAAAEALSVRRMLWERRGMPEATVRAGQAQHAREVELRLGQAPDV